ncbi:MAG: hypothetical protein HY363_00575 [Candidatus Aenigmarchaeota archaeon]|nr:hypothetical protein [Candidatus Aenigmarchaeota archaeon]
MFPQLLLMIGFLMAFFFFLFLFIGDIIAVVLNGVIIYLIGLRAYVEITKYKRFEQYFFALLGALFIVWLAGNLLPLWRITTAIILMFVIAQITKMIRK